MISDTLSESAAGIREYLATFPEGYPPDSPLTVRIRAVVALMDLVRCELDRAPGPDAPLTPVGEALRSLTPQVDLAVLPIAEKINATFSAHGLTPNGLPAVLDL